MHIELDAWEHTSKLGPKASLHKGGSLRLPPTKGAGRSANRTLCGYPLWRLAFGLSLEFCSQEFQVLLPSIQFYVIKCLDLDCYWALQP